MQNATAGDLSSIDRNSQRPRQTKESALDPTEYEHLFHTTFGMDEYYGLQCRFILVVAGRLGLRRGELTHMKESWIDWRRHRIEIPSHEECDKGRNGGPCGHCRQCAESEARHAVKAAAEDLVERRETTESPKRERLLDRAAAELLLEPDHVLGLVGDRDTFDELHEQLLAERLDAIVPKKIGDRWIPKTENAVREVPFSHSPRAEIILQDFFDEWDEWPFTGQAVNRRVSRMVDRSEDVDECFPHALRATAASHLAAQGMSTLGLQSMMGWATPGTARHYIASSGDVTARELETLNR